MILPKTYEGLCNIARDYKAKPRFHGNGFVQLYLSPAYRLHVFDPRFPATRVENARIHDHRWDMHSTVLMGRLIHSTYHVTKAGPSGGYTMYEPRGASKGTKLTEIYGLWDAQETGSYEFAAGSQYNFPARQFHDSANIGVTMTLIFKGSDDGKSARILAPVGQKPDHAFDKQPAEVELWSSIRAAYNDWLDS